MSEEPIACQLTDSEFRARRDGLLAAVRDIVVTATWQREGLALEVPPSLHALGLLLGLIAAERTCCPFLQFRLDAGPADAPTRLTITGPPGSRAFLETLRLAPRPEETGRSQEIET
jgi:hypothetical protein